MNTTCDFFKLVCTKERQGLYYTCVPHKWESKNILHWPSHLSSKHREKYRSNAASFPEKNWTRDVCTVKCNFINTFSDGLRMETSFTNCSDTEAEEKLLADISSSGRKRREIDNACGEVDVDHLMAANCSEAYKKTEVEISPLQFNGKSTPFVGSSNKEQVNSLTDLSAPMESDKVVEPMVFVLSHNTPNQQALTLPDADVNNKNMVYVDELDQNLNIGVINYLELIQTEISNLSTRIQNMENNFEYQNAKTMVMLDEILSSFKEKIHFYSNSSQKDKEPLEKSEDMLIFPIKDQIELEKFNNKIQIDLTYKNQLIVKFSEIGGTNEHECGFKVAYQLADYIFEPTLLTKYSWTGIFKRKLSTEMKAPFIQFRGIVDIFFEVVSKADNRYTTLKNISFFRDKILKHSKKRTERKKNPVKLDSVCEDVLASTNSLDVSNGGENSEKVVNNLDEIGCRDSDSEY